MSKFIMLSIAGMAVAIASPVLAAPTSDGASNLAVPTPAPAPSATPNAAQRFCVIDTITGSRIPQKTCLTREQWMSRGFDPLNP